MADTEALLIVDHLSKTFGQNTINEKRALDQISFQLKAGEFVTVIGGNGAGKSTLLNCIAGVYEPEEGSVVLNGKDITTQPEYKRSAQIGRVFQDPLKGTAFDMTIEENLSIAYGKGKTRGLTQGLRKADISYFKEQLSTLGLGLEDRLKTKVGLLSGGQRQALTLLMATLVRPKLLLLDEHTAALDPGAARKVLELTDAIIKENNLCTLMITHNMAHALEHGTRTILMHEGRIVLDIEGKQREGMTVDGLIELFTTKSGEGMSDRMLLI